LQTYDSKHGSRKMTLAKKLLDARKKKGLTQEELADKTNITVRTIQRIESGETIPRAFTLRTLAAALETTLVDFEAPVTPDKNCTASTEEQIHFSKTLTLSCFTYLVLPIVHFVIPIYLLKRNTLELSRPVVTFCRRLILQQVYWVIALNIAMLSCVAYNTFEKSTSTTGTYLSYLAVAGFMYLVNAVVLCVKLVQAQKLRRS
jgi:XRE family transcriptional regulator, regulator of sulfur utilization